jgi:3-(3-hydroxy-phenyl)propionate hydroxylase
MTREATPERVIIAGGGPAGMSAALFLVAAGVPVLLLERGSRPHDDPRAATYHPPTLEMLEPSGVTDELHARGIVTRRWQFRDRRDGLVAEFDLAALGRDTHYPYRLQCEQHKLVAMMQARVAGSPLAEIIHGAEVTDVAQDDAGVTVTTAGAGGRRFRGRYLIGADGGRSVVRKSQGIGFEGFTWPERFLVITTTVDFEPLGYAYSSYTMDPVEWTATFKIPGDDDRGRWRCVFPTDPEEDEARLLDFGHAREKLQGFIPRREPYEVVHTNLYAVHQRVATRFAHGRVLLVGDAAHVNNPLGGMGLNFGIHDAHNLAGRLARIWRGEPAEPLFGQFDRQRRTVAENTLQAQTIANKQTLEERDPARRGARQGEMRRIAADTELSRKYLLRTSMIEGVRAAAAID